MISNQNQLGNKRRIKYFGMHLVELPYGLFNITKKIFFKIVMNANKGSPLNGIGRGGGEGEEQYPERTCKPTRIIVHYLGTES